MPTLRTLFRGIRPAPVPPSDDQTDTSVDALPEMPWEDDDLILVERREMLVMDPETAKAYMAAMAPVTA